MSSNQADLKRRRVAVYRRSATVEPSAELSLQKQVVACVETCNAMFGPDNYWLTDICDAGMSGLGPGSLRQIKQADRAGLRRLIEMLEKQEIDHVVIIRADRLTRSCTFWMDFTSKYGERLIVVES